MTILRSLGVIATAAYALFCAATIGLLSVHPYEWMIGDTDLGHPPVTRCTLPDPIDDRRGLTATATFLLVAILLIPPVRPVSALARARLVVGAGLLVFWFYRFFGRTLGC